MAQSDRYREQPFFDRIVNVGWAAGGIAIVEVLMPGSGIAVVEAVDPPDTFAEFFTGSVILPADYQEAFIFRLNQGSTGEEVVAEEAYTSWVIDGYAIGNMADDMSSTVASGTAAFGYPPNIHVSNGQLWWNHVNLTHPNFSSISFINGYTFTNRHATGYPVNERPPDGVVLDQDLSNNQEYAWYRAIPHDPETVGIIRRAWLVNLKNQLTAVLIARDQLSTYETSYSLRLFRSGTTFEVAEGHVTAQGGVEPTLTQTGTIADQTTIVRQFGSNGFTS